MRFPMALAAAAMPALALAAAPQPVKPVPATLYSGRWYEIARTPNIGQRDCEAASSTFTGAAPGPLRVVQTCHKGSAYGPAETQTAQAHVLPGSNNAKVKMSFLGGLISQEYWIVDHADDNSWAI